MALPGFTRASQSRHGAHSGCPSAAASPPARHEQGRGILVQSRQRLIQLGLLIIVAVMPFHAFLSVWLGGLTHHEAVIQSWKEVLLAVLTMVATVWLWRDPAARQRLHQPVFYLVAASIGLGLLVTAIARPSFATAIFGFKTDDEFLLAFILAALVATPAFMHRLVKVTLAAASVVVA